MSAATTVAAQSRGSTSASRLVGTWALTVTLRDCATNAAMGAPFNSLATINSDGTSIGSTASLAFAAGQRSLEHGSWFHQGGHRYSESVVALIVFDSAANLPGTPEFDPTLPVRPGLYAGWQTITHTLVLQDANHYTAAGTTQFYSADGSVYRRGCSSSVGERFE
ncbi:MAG: hypothetical protein ABI868_02005 [Acidobacteriota bacterium]